jgi:hypothetical protein
VLTIEILDSKHGYYRREAMASRAAHWPVGNFLLGVRVATDVGDTGNVGEELMDRRTSRLVMSLALLGLIIIVAIITFLPR